MSSILLLQWEGSDYKKSSVPNRRVLIEMDYGNNDREALDPSTLCPENPSLLEKLLG